MAMYIMFNEGEPTHDSNFTTVSQQVLEKDQIVHAAVDYNTVVIFQYVVYTVLCQGIDLFGIGTNIINIMCFIKQGFKDPVNISLLGLAISDLGCLATLIWLNISFTPAFIQADVPFDTIEFQYLFGGMMHACFTRVTGWITAFITLERCLCIVAPLKVHRIVTPKRVCITIIFLFVILIGSGTPIYAVNRLDYKFFPDRNKTLIGLVYTEDRDRVEKISYIVNNVFIPFSSYFVIVFCTIILVIKLRKATKWRTESSTAVQTDSTSSSNQKVSKMVVMISTIFIACFIPVCITFLTMSLLPGFSFEGEHRNTLIIIGGIGIILESINSSVNIFFYFHMSSKYRETFRQIIRVNTVCK